jgi:hypothetical protein
LAAFLKKVLAKNFNGDRIELCGIAIEIEKGM